MYTQQEVEIAVVARDALLLLWLTILPWRQRNLREARIGAPPRANIFKAGKPRSGHMALPESVSQALQDDPQVEFWQFSFREKETKKEHAVRGALPQELVAMLEPYVQIYRPVLCRANDPGTLFVTDAGAPLSENALREIVVTATLRHAGKAVPPHLFRDAFAYNWLDDRPEDFLTLSKILWHRNIDTTIRIYGHNFDESDGAAKVEKWLSDRRARLAAKKSK